jgi:hypothetical protein
MNLPSMYALTSHDSLYFLLEDLLSPQKHYDWGLRAFKSVLVVAGSLLRAQAGQVRVRRCC